MKIGHESVESGASSFARALDQTEYGKFHFLLFVFVGLTYSATAMETTMVSFVIPSAKCDFHMSSEHAGYLSALPMLGVTLGSFFWGCVADLVGRRYVMITSLLMAGLCGIASSISQFFPLFVLLRFLNGFALVGALSLCLTYLGEFQPTAFREKVLCWMELFWTVGIIGTPCLAWLLIPLNIRMETEYFRLSSWNVFVAASATPTILLACWAAFLPESPKFLFEIGDYDKALDVLKGMYAQNTGKPGSLYPVETLREKTVSIVGGKMKTEKRRKDLPTLLKNLQDMFWTLIEPRYRNKTLLVCYISFGLSASYYTLMMWFPEVFTRFEAFEAAHPGRPGSVCDVSAIFLTEDTCHGALDTKVYLNTVIVGLACIPTSLWLPLCVNRLGTKFFMIFTMVVAGGMSLGMYFVINSTQNLVLSAIFEAMTSLALVTLYCSLVDIFPTKVRVMATGLSICSGRIGGLVGNLVFGFLIDMNCFIPIIIFSTLLISTGLLCFFLPVSRNKDLL